jgi:hypothetical protein
LHSLTPTEHPTHSDTHHNGEVLRRGSKAHDGHVRGGGQAGHGHEVCAAPSKGVVVCADLQRRRRVWAVCGREKLLQRGGGSGVVSPGVAFDALQRDPHGQRSTQLYADHSNHEQPAWALAPRSRSSSHGRFSAADKADEIRLSRQPATDPRAGRQKRRAKRRAAGAGIQCTQHITDD